MVSLQKVQKKLIINILSSYCVTPVAELELKYNKYACPTQASTGFLRGCAKYKCGRAAVFQNPYNFAAGK